MSLKTWVNELRFNRKVEQEKTNAGQSSAHRNTSVVRMFGIPAFAVTFMFALVATQPVAAAGMNDSISPILTDVAALFTPLLSLVIAAIPLIVAIAVIGFVLGILAAILGKLKI